MGTGGSGAAVADAGPLIHLREIDSLDLLSTFEALHVPDAVWSEAVETGRVPEAQLTRLSIIHRYAVSQSEVAQFLEEGNWETLDAGEIECLVLCRQLGVKVLLTDDLAAREAARRAGCTPVGSLGVVIRAYRQGLVSLLSAEEHLNRLYEVSTLFVTWPVVEMAIEQLHQSST